MKRFLNNNKALINLLSFVYFMNQRYFQVHDFKDLGNKRKIISYDLPIRFKDNIL